MFLIKSCKITETITPQKGNGNYPWCLGNGERVIPIYGWWDMQCQLIGSIVSIVFVFIDAIDFIDRINRINRIDPGVLNWSVLLLKDNWNDPIKYGMEFWGKNENFLRLLAFIGIWKDFTRSIWEINNIPLGIMACNSPRGKIFTLRKNWGSNLFSRKKGNYYSNLPPMIHIIPPRHWYPTLGNINQIFHQYLHGRTRQDNSGDFKPWFMEPIPMQTSSWPEIWKIKTPSHVVSVMYWSHVWPQTKHLKLGIFSKIV